MTILGNELAGIVEVIGKDVTEFKKGDQVFSQAENLGANAEYLSIPKDSLAMKPENLTYHPQSDMLVVAFTNIFGNFDEHDIFIDELMPSIIAKSSNSRP